MWPYPNRHLGNNLEKIKDGKDLNNFGVLFHDTSVIEDFQKRSGMGGAYTVEYQHHYIAAVGRLEADNQVLDIAIPLALFNYHQEVAGASVEFNLQEVGEANTAAMPKAIDKFGELEETPLFKALAEMGITDWTIHGMHSIHAHPSGVNRFSGTDLRENIDHPGVNFPLSVGEDVPNFASIIQHKELFAEIIHTEYRMFNGVDKGLREYKKGRTLTLIKGYEAEPPPPPEPDGIIDTIFGTTRTKKYVATPKEREDKVLKDEFSGEEGNEFAKEMMELWKATDFKPDITEILKTNVLRGSGRLQQRGFQGKHQTVVHGNHGNKNAEKKGKQGTLPGTTNKEKILSDKEALVIKYLISKGYRQFDVINWDVQTLIDTYQAEMTDDFVSADVWKKGQYSSGEIVQYEDKYYRVTGTNTRIQSQFPPDESINVWDDITKDFLEILDVEDENGEEADAEATEVYTWEKDTIFDPGDIVDYMGVEYIFILDEPRKSLVPPPTSPVLWEKRDKTSDGEPTPWACRATYEFGDKVTYEGKTYTQVGSADGIISVSAPDKVPNFWEEDGIKNNDLKIHTQEEEDLIKEKFITDSIYTHLQLQSLSRERLAELYIETYGVPK